MKIITEEELYYTYRKVKRELFNNKDTVYFDRIITFEENLVRNIKDLKSDINNYLSNSTNDTLLTFIDDCEVFNTLKRISLEENRNELNCDLFDTQITTLSKEIDYPSHLMPEIKGIKFRTFGDLTISFQIIAGLWLNRVGYELDKEMPENSYGNRLKEGLSSKKNYKENHSYYKSYFNEYKKWQENLIDKITECNCSDETLVIATDFQDFFPEISLNKLQKIINDKAKGSIPLTNLLFDLIATFNKEFNCKGLPLNLICSSTLANIYLLDFDDWVLKNLNPLYYGRYVDDLLIALDAKDEFAQKLISNKESLSDILCLELKKNLNDYHLTFNSTKSKFFLLNNSDKNKFKKLKEHLNATSSEWRLIPTTEKYNEKNVDDLFSENFNTSYFLNLKDINNEITRRNYFIKEILSFERTYFIMDEVVWRERLGNLFLKLEEIVFDLKNFEIFQKHIPRLIGLLIQTRNENLISNFLKRLDTLLDFIEKNVQNDLIEFNLFRNHLKSKSLEFISYFEPVSNTKNSYEKNKSLINFFGEKNLSDLDGRNKLYFNCDIHFEPIINTLYKYNEYQQYLNCKDTSDLDRSIQLNESEKKFISSNLNSISCQKKKENDECNCSNKSCVEIYETFGFYFFTRRITLLELSIAFKNKIIDSTEKDNFVSIARRFYSKYKEEIVVQPLKKFDYVSKVVIKNSTKKTKRKVVICNTHFLTKDDSYDCTLHGLPESDVERVDRIINLVNTILKSKENIDYVVFHELSIPRNLYIILSLRLSFAGINLVAGIEYKIDKDKFTVDNQLLYVLNLRNDDYYESIALYQSKILPAIHEERNIRESESYKMEPLCKNKLIINHNEFVFSGMICNDLINIDNRVFLRGEIDLLFVVAWNTDIGMYEHLVQTTAFDSHVYVLLCNNRKYGDSHIFVPYKEDFRRYLQRINGGEKDNWMISEVDIVELRSFQINKISPNKTFKPLPTGYDMSTDRRESLVKLLKLK